MKNHTSKAKGTKKIVKQAALKDLKPSKTEATKGGATRSDPYKNFKFRP